MTEGATGASLSKRLFTARLSLIAELDKRDVQEAEKALRSETAGRLHEEVAAMNVENFIVRPKRRFVETYRVASAWEKLGVEQQHELPENVAGLPSEIPAEDEEAKRFDLLMLRLQLALLRAEPGFIKLQDQVRSIAEALEDQASIPMVRERLELIQEIQTDEYWSLIGLDREAAKDAFASFFSGKRLSANQIEFINLIIDHPTEHGIIEAKRLYEIAVHRPQSTWDEVKVGTARVIEPSDGGEMLRARISHDPNSALCLHGCRYVMSLPR